MSNVKNEILNISEHLKLNGINVDDIKEKKKYLKEDVPNIFEEMNRYSKVDLFNMAEEFRKIEKNRNDDLYKINEQIQLECNKVYIPDVINSIISNIEKIYYAK